MNKVTRHFGTSAEDSINEALKSLQTAIELAEDENTRENFTEARQQLIDVWGHVKKAVDSSY